MKAFQVSWKRKLLKEDLRSLQELQLTLDQLEFPSEERAKIQRKVDRITRNINTLEEQLKPYF
jgi:hypothetical protein